MKEKVKAEYRSSIRSKELIKEAYFKMLQKKPPEKITVTDIVNTAKINRGTFYAHYGNIIELSESLEQELCNELYLALQKFANFRNNFSPLEALLEFSDFFEKNQEIYRVLFYNKTSECSVIMLQNLFKEYMESNTEIDEEIRNSAEFKIRVRFFAAGVANSYKSYFNGELNTSLNELAKILSNMILECSILKNKKEPKHMHKQYF